MLNSSPALYDFINWEFEIDFVRSEALKLVKDLGLTGLFDKSDLVHIKNKLSQTVTTVKDFENIIKQSIGLMYELFNENEFDLIENSVENCFDRIILLYRYSMHVIKKFSKIL